MLMPRHHRGSLIKRHRKLACARAAELVPFGASPPHTDLQFLVQMRRFAAKLAKFDISVPKGDHCHGDKEQANDPAVGRAGHTLK
eukprot:SAG11_NODE_10906_length_797_cov_2.120344_2_plen_85_part_00